MCCFLFGRDDRRARIARGRCLRGIRCLRPHRRLVLRLPGGWRTGCLLGSLAVCARLANRRGRTYSLVPRGRCSTWLDRGRRLRRPSCGPVGLGSCGDTWAASAACCFAEGTPAGFPAGETWAPSAEGGPEAAAGAPHFWQNFAPSTIFAPHLIQNMVVFPFLNIPHRSWQAWRTRSDHFAPHR